MAATNYTPISLYYSTTAAATPTAGNLVNGELAINITDGKLFYKDNLGVVKVLIDTATSGITTNSVTFNTSGGNAAGTSFNGSAAVTVDYSTVGADAAGTAVALAIALG